MNLTCGMPTDPPPYNALARQVVGFRGPADRRLGDAPFGVQLAAMKFLLCLCALFLGSLHAADTLPPVKTDRFQLSKFEDEYGYRTAVRVGNTLYVSGDTAGGAMPDAIREVYGNLRATLAHYGLTFQHVVKETVYTTQLDVLKENRAIRREIYGTEFPAATWVQVNRLFNPEYVIEVELIAVFPEEKEKAK